MPENTPPVNGRLARLPRWMWNRYVLTGAAFVAWMLFFDRNDVFTQWEIKGERAKLEERTEWHRQQVVALKKDRESLMTDRHALEQFAREKYKMKRDDEDLFLIVHGKTAEAPKE